MFGDRVCLFGSHDDENGDTYCPLDDEFHSPPSTTLTLRTRGTGSGVVTVTAGTALVELSLTRSQDWREDQVTLPFEGGAILELDYRGPGTVDLLSLRFN